MATNHNFRIKKGLEVGGTVIVNSDGLMTIPTTSVGATQDGGTNNTRLATTAFVQQELTTALATKLPLTGGTLTGNLVATTANFTGNVALGNSGTSNSLIVGGSYGKKYWTKSYAVSNTNISALTNEDGTSLATGGAYRFTGHIDGTGTDQSSRAVFWNENGTWNVNVTGQSGTNSNHIQFLVSGGVPSVKTYHANNYTVRVWHERINLNENAGSDNSEHYFGADAYLSKIGDNLSLNASTTVNGSLTSTGSITTTDGSGSFGISGDASSNTYLIATGEIRVRPSGTSVNKFVIGSNGNVTTAGTINSGAITSSGSLTLSSNSTSVNTRSLLARDTNGLNIGTTNSTTAISIDNSANVTMPYNLVVSGNLTVNGTQTKLNVATLEVEDKNITLNYGAGDTSGSANGAGITIQDAVNSTTNATILWNASSDQFDFSHKINVTGDFQAQNIYNQNINVLNAAGNGWHTWATRNNNKVDLNVGTINSGAITSTGTSTFGRIQTGLGSVASPAVKVGDPDSGLYDSGANMIGVALGGVLEYDFQPTQFDMKANNLIGVGTITSGAITATSIDGGTSVEANSMFVNTPDGGSAPAMTALLKLYGYEGRGAGIKIRDNANSATGASNREWFIGSGYSQSGFNIGYSSTGSQSSYTAQNKLSIDTSGNTTIAGTISSGAITSSGVLTLNNNYAMINGGTVSNTTLEPVIWARSKIGASVVQMNVQGDEWQFGGGGTLDTTPILKLKYGNNAATFAGTISSGAITSSGRLSINQPSSNTNNELIVMRANDVYADQIWTDNSGSIRLRTSSGAFSVFTGGAANSTVASGSTTRLSINAAGNSTFGGAISSGAITSTGTSTFGRILTGLGSVASPALQVGDVDSGLYDSGANMIGISLGGALEYDFSPTQLDMKANNLIGVGTITSSAISATGQSLFYKAGTNNVQTIVAVVGSNSTRPVLQFSESAATTINAGMSLEYNGQGSGDTNFMSINNVSGASKFKFLSGGDLDILSGGLSIGGVEVITSARALTNVGTITAVGINVNGNVEHQGLTMTAGTDIDQIYTAAKTLTITTSFADTGIDASDLQTGTYLVQLQCNDHAIGGAYSMIYSGTMSWTSGDTNDLAVDEIVLHRAGHAVNGKNLFLRVQYTATADVNNLKLQIRGNYAATGSSTYTFKFRRMI